MSESFLIIQIYFIIYISDSSTFMPNKPGTVLVELCPEDKEFQAVEEEVCFYIYAT